MSQEANKQHNAAAPAVYEQVGIAMTCRSYEEYERMFMLKEEFPPQGSAILDVAAGASSFTAELRQRGYLSVACDPLYRLTANELHTHGLNELAIAAQRLEAIKHVLVWKDYSSLEGHDEIRHRSLQKFVDHYREQQNEQHIADITELSIAGRCYVTAQLPDLPFQDNSFELVLCNHFLFLYHEQFDAAFHLQSLLELLRVTKPGGRVLVYPLVGFDHKLYPNLTELENELAAAGAEISLRKTAFRFLPTADSFLQLIKL